MPVFENEPALIQRLLNRDETAMAFLYQHAGKFLYPVIFRIVRSAPAAEDVLQESMIKIWFGIGKYDARKGQLITWCLRVCRNAAIDHVRDHRVRAARRTQGIEESQLNHHAAPTTFQPEHVGVREYAERLRPEYRRLIHLLYFDGLTQVEAAEALQLPLGTVKTHSRQALRELIQQLR